MREAPRAAGVEKVRAVAVLVVLVATVTEQLPEAVVVAPQTALQELQRNTLAVVVVVVVPTRLAVVVVRGKEVQALMAILTALQIQEGAQAAILVPLVLAAVEL